jgi:hypothetical protein
MGKVIVFMPPAGKEVVSRIGRHKFITTYRPDEPDERRWHWRLKVVVTYEYVGNAVTPALCRIEAEKFAEMHDNMEKRHG